MHEAQNLLKKYYGYEKFRPGQEAIISHILKGEDALGIMPTGAREIDLLPNTCSYFKRHNNCNLSTYFTYERSS